MGHFYTLENLLDLHTAEIINNNKNINELSIEIQGYKTTIDQIRSRGDRRKQRFI